VDLAGSFQAEFYKIQNNAIHTTNHKYMFKLAAKNLSRAISYSNSISQSVYHINHYNEVNGDYDDNHER